MKLFLDTANLAEIEKAKEYGLIDGITTNPSLLAKEGGDWRKQAKLVCKAVEGPVSLEVFATKAEKMLEEARDLITFGPNVVVKCPCTAEGLLTIRQLSKDSVPTNCTLVFSPLQALLAAKAGATYVSPFVGRLDDIGRIGMDLVKQIVTIFTNYSLETQVLVASIRNPTHVLDAALMGADAATIPFKVVLSLLRHPLTDSGLAQFVTDAKSLK